MLKITQKQGEGAPSNTNAERNLPEERKHATQKITEDWQNREKRK